MASEMRSTTRLSLRGLRKRAQENWGNPGHSSQIGTSSFVFLTGLIFKSGILLRIRANERCLQARFEPRVRLSLGDFPW
jgi:hypothetical protein